MEVFENPAIFYLSIDEPIIPNILEDLKKGGFNENVQCIELSKDELERAQTEICNDLTTPFILFCAEGKVNWKRIGKIAGISFGLGLASVVAAPLVLTAAGFTSGGVAAGSAAAAAQSAFYGGATGGIFSILQSAGAVGIGIFGNTAIGLAGASAGAGLAAAAGAGANETALVRKPAVIGILSRWARNNNNVKNEDKKKIKTFTDKKLGIKEDPNYVSWSIMAKNLFQTAIGSLEALKPTVLVYFKDSYIKLE